jgi:hypothetical protein
MCLDNIYINTRGKSFTILASLDEDDSSMNNEDVISKMKAYDRLVYFFGQSKSKIDAVNRDVEKIKDWDLLINTSDDMLFVENGFDDIIKRDFKSNFENLDGFIHYNDGNQKANVCTMSIMGRSYYERFNYIYYPEYKSLWADCEATNVAKLLGKYKYMGDDKILFRHYHPAWGLAKWDEQYKKTEAPEMWAYDEKIYNERATKNFYV